MSICRLSANRIEAVTYVCMPPTANAARVRQTLVSNLYRGWKFLLVLMVPTTIPYNTLTLKSNPDKRGRYCGPQFTPCGLHFSCFLGAHRNIFPHLSDHYPSTNQSAIKLIWNTGYIFWPYFIVTIFTRPDPLL